MKQNNRDIHMSRGLWEHSMLATQNEHCNIMNTKMTPLTNIMGQKESGGETYEKISES